MFTGIYTVQKVTFFQKAFKNLCPPALQLTYVAANQLLGSQKVVQYSSTPPLRHSTAPALAEKHRSHHNAHISDERPICSLSKASKTSAGNCLYFQRCGIAFLGPGDLHAAQGAGLPRRAARPFWRPQPPPLHRQKSRRMDFGV